jgi:hypothetical protein
MAEDDAARLRELERVNSELAAELRRLVERRAAEPRRGAIPTGRGLHRLAEELAEAEAELAGLRVRNRELEAHVRELGVSLHEHAEYGRRLGAEVGRLESGALARLRRLLERLVR